MLLKQLNIKEKDSFLKLVISVVRTDESFDESQKAFIDEYAKEMDIQSYEIDAVIDINQLLKNISKKSTTTVKRIFLVELAACVYTDRDFGKDENDLLESMIIEFGLDRSDLSKCYKLLSDYTSAATALTRFIQEGK